MMCMYRFIPAANGLACLTLGPKLTKEPLL